MKTKGKYFIDEIDGVVFSTDSYELFNLYNKLFFEEPEPLYLPKKNSFECDAKANRESFLKGIEQEKHRYKDGYKYVSEWYMIRGKRWKKGRWVKEVG